MTRVLETGKMLCHCGVAVGQVTRDEVVVFPSGDHHGVAHHPRFAMEDIQDAMERQRIAWVMRSLTRSEAVV